MTLAQRNGTNELHFYYGSDGKPAFVRMGVDWYAYVYNLQGDVIALTNNSGSVVVAYSYDAWGKPLGMTGTLATTLGRVNPFRYRGYVYDEETGLYYLRSRYYRAEICRFLTEDFVIDGNPEDNKYYYTNNSPINRQDADGTHDYLEQPVFVATYNASSEQMSLLESSIAVWNSKQQDCSGYVIGNSYELVEAYRLANNVETVEFTVKYNEKNTHKTKCAFYTATFKKKTEKTSFGILSEMSTVGILDDIGTSALCLAPYNPAFAVTACLVIRGASALVTIASVNHIFPETSEEYTIDDIQLNGIW